MDGRWNCSASKAPPKAEVVKLRYFVGLTHGEIAQVLGLSEKTVQRYWAYAKVWLYQHIRQRTRHEPRFATSLRRFSKGKSTFAVRFQSWISYC